MKNGKRILCLPTLALTLTALCAAQQAPKVIGNAVANQPVHFDVSRPLSELATETLAPQGIRQTHAPLRTKPLLSIGALHSQAAAPISAVTANISATVGLGFEGVDQIGDSLSCPPLTGFFYVPPDTNAAVGDTQIVQWVNVCYAVFDKSSGAVVAGPFAGTNFWKGFGGPCEANNDGDPIIQWDKANHRWIAAQNVFNGPPYYTCVAVSQTSDASGSYYRYMFPQSAGFPDYPKWGLQPNTYYQSQNVFGSTGFLGVNVCAYQANLMRHGNPNAKQVCILDNSNGTLFDDSMLPADDDTPSGHDHYGESIGNFLPAGDDEPSDAEVYLGSIDNFLPGDTHVYEYVFSVNFRKPGNSKLAGVDGSMPISVPAFDLAYCTSGSSLTTNCVPQPTPGSDLLDTLGDRLMYRLAHLDRHDTHHFLVAHSVNNSSAVATTWYEFRSNERDTTKLSLHQSGITPDDGHYRWMGSVAMNQAGDVAVGYSRSSAQSGDYPSLYFAGQTAGDPLGTTETEAVIKQGGGSQMHSFSRWGDYSSMALDGSDSCTFWYTNEFYPVDGSFAWSTWIASLNFHNCHFEN